MGSESILSIDEEGANRLGNLVDKIPFASELIVRRQGGDEPQSLARRRAQRTEERRRSIFVKDATQTENSVGPGDYYRRQFGAQPLKVTQKAV